jgi:hypothetical protein
MGTPLKVTMVLTALLTLACGGSVEDGASTSGAGSLPPDSNGGCNLPAQDRCFEFYGAMTKTPEGLAKACGNYKGNIVDSCPTGQVAACKMMGGTPLEFVLVVYEGAKEHLETICTGGEML